MRICLIISCSLASSKLNSNCGNTPYESMIRFSGLSDMFLMNKIEYGMSQCVVALSKTVDFFSNVNELCHLLKFWYRAHMPLHSFFDFRFLFSFSLTMWDCCVVVASIALWVFNVAYILFMTSIYDIDIPNGKEFVGWLGYSGNTVTDFSTTVPNYSAIAGLNCVHLWISEYVWFLINFPWNIVLIEIFWLCLL